MNKLNFMPKKGPASPKRSEGGFSLIELLIVLLIIAMIAALSVVIYDNLWQRSRDHKRASDILKIQTALAQYYKDEGHFPDNLTPGQALISPTTGTTYLTSVPSNPTPWDEPGCLNSDYTYGTSTDIYNNENYYINFCLGSKTEEINSGFNHATKNEIINTYAIPASGLQFWGMADGPMTTRISGGNTYVSEWKDLSGKNNNATQTNNGQQPLLLKNIINGKPVLNFINTADNILNLPKTAKPYPSGTVIFVTRATSLASDPVYSVADVGTGYPEIRIYNEHTSLYISGQGGYQPAVTAADPRLDWNIVSYVLNNSNYTHSIYSLGALGQSRSFNGPVPDSDAVHNEIGGYLNTYQNYPGYIAEIIIYNRVLSDTERQGVEKYLSGKYKLNLAY